MAWTSTTPPYTGFHSLGMKKLVFLSILRGIEEIVDALPDLPGPEMFNQEKFLVNESKFETCQV